MTQHCNSPASFGKLNAAQSSIVKRFVAGRQVMDLGAGDFELSRCLVDLGASKVYAVERATRHGGILEVGTPYEAVTVVAAGLKSLGRVARHKKRAEELPPVTHRGIDVALVSWPSPEDSKFSAHADYSLLEPIRKARTVIYLGSNVDGTICGSKRLYQHLAKRRVFAHEPDRRNTLIVYGPLLPRGQERELLPEERAGLDTSRVYTFKEAYGTVTADEVLRGAR